MKRILVTGGAGFIGSHLCERLLQNGNNVVCIDNYLTGSINNIAHLLQSPNFKAIQHDVTEPFSTEVDEIYNLACPASPVQYQNNPLKTIKTIVLGAINMLDLAKNNKAKILQASTSEVYGDALIQPQTENYWGNVNPIGLRSCYDEGKRCAESIFINYHLQYRVRTKIIRIFNTYGPRMHPNDGRVVSNFIVHALQNKEITIYGKGTQTRCFQYIDDLIEGIIKMMNTSDHIIGPINIGNPKAICIKDLAKIIIKKIGSQSKIVFLPLPPDDPKHRQPDITLANKLLGNWIPKVELENGLKNTIEYFESKLQLDGIIKGKP